MRMRRSKGARFLAGALFLCLSSAGRSQPLRLAAERRDGDCSSGSKLLGLTELRVPLPPGSESKGCILRIALAELSEAEINRAASLLETLHGAAGALFESPQAPDPERLAYAVKRLSSVFRSGSPEGELALDYEGPLDAALGEEIAPYIDALAERVDRPRPHLEAISRRWILVINRRRNASVEVLEALDTALRRADRVSLVAVVAEPVAVATGPSTLPDRDRLALERLQRYLTPDVSRDPTPTKGKLPDGMSLDILRFYDAKKFTPILALAENPSGNVSIELSGGPFVSAAVENVSNGARRDFNLRGAKTLTLDLSKGSLVVVLQPAQRPGGETRTTVEVGATRGLTAEEIVARERVWDAGQREKVSCFIADMKASLRFRIGRAHETFDLTIHGPFYFRRGEPADWRWNEFYLNGVKWKGKTLPKLPILQPEKVTTLPLDICLTEDYSYALHAETTVSGRGAYHLTFAPKSASTDKPIYRGSLWIDKQTFALLRRDSVQLNLKGEALSNVQTEFYRPLPGRPDVFLPLEIKGEQVFSTAGRTTAIERNVVMVSVDLNPSDFAERHAAAYQSAAQMIRDTEKGMRYLVPDPARPGERIVEEKISKKNTFALLGGFYDSSLSFPIPLAGLQHFNFDLFGRGKQLSVFFGGALLTANYTDPSLAGSRFDLGADLFGVALAFGDVSYRNGKEVSSEKIKHLPAVFQVNLGHPIGPYLKTSIGLFTKWDNYQRDKDTGPNFVVPVDTFTDGAELRLVGNYSGFNAMISGSYFRRRRWEPWGDPATSEYDPRQKEYWKYSVIISKDQYFPGFRKLHMGLGYLGGRDLDRFSKYEFGAFSGNPIRGYKSGSLRTEKAIIANLSYGINFEDIIRFEGFYDQALLTDRRSGFDRTYFSGVGLLASLNGPLENSLVRGEIGIPVVSHGVRGFVINVILLKLF